MTESVELLTKIIQTLEKYQSPYPEYFDHFENILMKTRL